MMNTNIDQPVRTKDPRAALAAQLAEIDEAIYLNTDEAAHNDWGIGSPEDKEIFKRKMELLAVRKKVRTALNKAGVTNVQFGLARGMYGPEHYVSYNANWDMKNGPQ